MPVVQYEDPTYLEACYVALFNQLQAAVFAAGVKLQSVTRAVQGPTSIPTEDQPALVLINGPIEVVQSQSVGGFSLPKITMTAVAAIYLMDDGASANDQTSPSATLANYLAWGLFNSLSLTGQAPSAAIVGPYARQTLGGQVYHAWIDGHILTELQMQQAVITIPIMMLAGPSN